MMKRFSLFLFLSFIILSLIISGCGSASSVKEAPAAADLVCFTDDLGREVNIARPNRVAVLLGSFADMWCLAGGAATLCAAADDAWSSFELELAENVVNLGSPMEPNPENLLASDPDLVIASAGYAEDMKLKDTFDAAGIPFAYFEVLSFKDYLRVLKIFTELTGCPDNYEKYGTAIASEVDAARGMADGSSPSVLLIRTTGSKVKVRNSTGTVLGEMLSDLGCENIADSEASLLEELSMEVIMEKDPDYIFAVIQGDDTEKGMQTLKNVLFSDPAWNSLTAVKEDRFHVMDHKLYNLKPNALWGTAYENLAKILYG